MNFSCAELSGNLTKRYIILNLIKFLAFQTIPYTNEARGWRNSNAKV